jgi:arabinofuranosyltransferase
MGRLPLQDTTHWRIGHFRHIIPDGYLETLASGKNQIKDPNIRLYYEKLSFVIKGDLWSLPRFVEIWNLNVGKYDYLIKQ